MNRELTFNVNDNVKVRLTEYGKKILGGRLYPKPDKNGYYKFEKT